MAYVKRTWVTGSVIEVEKYFTFTYKNNKVTRMPKVNQTPEAMQKVNERNAVKKLRRLLNTNFGHNDMHLILTYEMSKRPDCKEDAKKDIEKFLRNLRKRYKKAGYELRYVSVAEYGKRSIHFHLVINKGISINELAETWPHGRIHVHPLDNSGDYSQLAEYLIKQTRKTFNDPDRAIYKKRWSSSTNLKQPEAIVEVVKSESWKEMPIAPAGYYLITDSIYTDVSDLTGYPYQYYKCIAIDNNAQERMMKRYGKRQRNRKNNKSCCKYSSRSNNEKHKPKA